MAYFRQFGARVRNCAPADLLIVVPIGASRGNPHGEGPRATAVLLPSVAPGAIPERTRCALPLDSPRTANASLNAGNSVPNSCGTNLSFYGKPAHNRLFRRFLDRWRSEQGTNCVAYPPAFATPPADIPRAYCGQSALRCIDVAEPKGLAVRRNGYPSCYWADVRVGSTLLYR